MSGIGKCLRGVTTYISNTLRRRLLTLLFGVICRLKEALRQQVLLGGTLIFVARDSRSSLARVKSMPHKIRTTHASSSSKLCKERAWKTLNSLETCHKNIQSWKAAHLPILEIRVEQKGNRAKKERKMGKKRKKIQCCRDRESNLGPVDN